MYNLPDKSRCALVLSALYPPFVIHTSQAEIKSMFNELKTAQAAAYLLHKAGGTMKHLKLMKLLYLADRLSWQEYDQSITGDEYYSLPYGPVLSKTLDLIQGNVFSATPTPWEEWISDKENHQVSLAKEIDFDDEYYLDNLSLANLEILDKTFEQYGHLETFDLVKLTHDSRHIPEWENPTGGVRAKPIKIETLLHHLGRTN